MWSFFGVLAIIHAAAFCTLWSLLIKFLERPYKRALQLSILEHTSDWMFSLFVSKRELVRSDWKGSVINCLGSPEVSNLPRRKFIIVTDHKLLKYIMDPGMAIHVTAAARFQRCCLFLGAFSYDIKFWGTLQYPNCDGISRLPLPVSSTETSDEKEVYQVTVVEGPTGEGKRPKVVHMKGSSAFTSPETSSVRVEYEWWWSRSKTLLATQRWNLSKSWRNPDVGNQSHSTPEAER